MCGILGYIGNIPETSWPEAHRLLSNIFSKSVDRGSHASGFSALHDLDSSQLITEKRPVDAAKLMNRSSRYKALRKYMPKIFIGHTRYSTSGPANRNRNNHPFNSNKYSLVHNGSITNWKTVADEIGIAEKMRTGCDSEMLLHLLEEQGGIDTGVQHMVDKLPHSSRIAIATMQHHAELDKRLWLFRNDMSPAFILTVPRWKAIFFASTESILDGALKLTYNDDASNVIKEYGIAKMQLPSWCLTEFGIQDGTPISMNKIDIDKPKIGFNMADTTDKKAKQELIVVNSGTSRENAAKPSAKMYGQDSSIRELINGCDPNTRGKIVDVTLAMEGVLPVVAAINANNMMQDIELQHFNTWMTRIL